MKKSSITNFNKMLNAYKNIESDSQLTKNKLTYQEYQSLGFLIDSLRYDKAAETIQKGVADWFLKFGFNVAEKGIGYKITLE